MVPIPILRVSDVLASTRNSSWSYIGSTTYVGQVLAKDTGKEPDHETATRMGDLALLWFSIGTKSSTIFTSEFTDSRVLVAVIAGTLLPHLSRHDQKLLAQDGDEDEDVEMA